MSQGHTACLPRPHQVPHARREWLPLWTQGLPGQMVDPGTGNPGTWPQPGGLRTYTTQHSSHAPGRPHLPLLTRGRPPHTPRGSVGLLPQSTHLEASPKGAGISCYTQGCISKHKDVRGDINTSFSRGTKITEIQEI